VKILYNAQTKLIVRPITRHVDIENSKWPEDFNGIPPGLIHISSQLEINHKDQWNPSISCSATGSSLLTFGRVVTSSLAGSSNH
jgi:hypothetical protein